MEPASGSVTVTMSGATFPGGQGAAGWGRSRQDLAPPVLLGSAADADLAPLAASPGRMADVASEVTIGVLGPLEVRVGSGEPVEVVGPRLRTLVIRLALDPDRVVLASQLIDAVWDEDPPAGATNAMQSLVCRLRDDVVAADGGVALVGLQQGGEDPHRGGLAGAVGAEDGQHRPGVVSRTGASWTPALSRRSHRADIPLARASG